MADYKKPKPNFYADLKFGQESEARFLAEHGQYLEQLDGKEGDFRIKGTNLKIESKQDRYDHDKYLNFICELYRSGTKPGGSGQAIEHGCRYFLYNFSSNGKFYFFDTVQFHARVKASVKKYKLPVYKISNGTYETSFYRIPRAYFEDIMLDFHSTVERKYKLAQKRKAKNGTKKP